MPIFQEILKAVAPIIITETVNWTKQKMTPEKTWVEKLLEEITTKK